MSRHALLLLLTLACLAPGCLYMGGRGGLGPDVRELDLSPIVVGETTRGEVLSLLGPPREFLEPEISAALFDDDLRLDGVLDVARRSEWVWTWQGETIDVDGSWLLVWAGVWIDSRVDLVAVGFDADGKVTFVTRTRRKPEDG